MGIFSIEVKVLPHASQEKILLLQPGRYKVYLKEKPLQGKANEVLVKMLGDYFGVSKTSVKILRGERARNKVVEIRDGK